MPVKDIRASELRELLKTNKDQIEIIDVREQFEYDAVHIKGSKLIPMRELQARVNEIDWNKQVVFICRSGARSKMMAGILAGTGKEIKNLQFGIYECFADGGSDNLEINSDLIQGYF